LIIKKETAQAYLQLMGIHESFRNN
jgi:hypothetical protein